MGGSDRHCLRQLLHQHLPSHHFLAFCQVSVLPTYLAPCRHLITGSITCAHLLPMQDLAATRLLFYHNTVLYGSHNPYRYLDNAKHNLAGKQLGRHVAYTTTRWDILSFLP